MNETELSIERKKSLVLQAIHVQAEDVIEIHRDLPIEHIIKILDKFYGEQIDSYDLLANFYQQSQTPGQSMSEYCTKLVHLGMSNYPEWRLRDRRNG